MTGLTFRNVAPGALNGATVIEFEWSDVAAWGRVTWFGDRRTFVAARLNDGRYVQITRSHQEESDRVKLEAISKRLAKELGQPHAEKWSGMGLRMEEPKGSE